MGSLDPVFGIMVELFWHEVHKLQGGRLNVIASYLPESDGLIRVVTKRLGKYLCCFASLAHAPKASLGRIHL